MKNSLTELARVFFRLGLTAFGGPAVHIALMEDEFVEKRKWLQKGDFLDLIAAANVIPGPNSTELAMHIGYLRRGWLGLIVAGSCFILPAALIVYGLAWSYRVFGQTPKVEAAFYGMKPVMIAIIVQVIWRLGKTTLTSFSQVFLAVIAATAALLGANEVSVIFGAGSVFLALHFLKHRSNVTSALFPVTLFSIGNQEPISQSLWLVFGVFAKIGALLFGSGYVLISFLKTELVEKHGLISNAQLLDAITIGQVTPGPVFTTATFLGYLIAGTAGAIVATFGIFAPAFLLVAATAPYLTAVKNAVLPRVFLNGVNVASIALIGVAAWNIGSSALVDLPTGFIFVFSLFIVMRFKLNPAWLLLAGSAIGLVLLKTVQ